MSDGNGYRQIKNDFFVSDEDAYDYALANSLNGTEQEQEEFRKMLIQWFYSGNWVRDYASGT